MRQAGVQAELARHSLSPSGFWLQGGDTQWAPPTQGSQAGLRNRFGALPHSAHLGSGLAGPAQKEKDTSASDNEWFIFLEGWGGARRAEGSLPSHPHSRHYPHAHAVRDGNRPPGLGTSPWGLEEMHFEATKNDRVQGVPGVAAEIKTIGRESQGTVVS